MPTKRRRAREEEPHENHERWLVSYADFITLLFAFFVVMYSISSINEGKYHVVSSAMIHAFRIVPSGNTSGTPNADKPLNAGALVSILEQYSGTEKQKIREDAHQIANKIRSALGELLKEGEVTVTETTTGIKLEINASILFPSGNATLNTEGIKTLTAVAPALSQIEFPIVVEGHTDNVPITTNLYPSNWELSAVRASTVVRYFIEAGVPPGRLSSAGYADQRPIADNASPEGRARNRRVAILIQSEIKPD